MATEGIAAMLLASEVYTSDTPYVPCLAIATEQIIVATVD